MSSIAIASSTPSNSLQQYFSTRQTDLHELGKDLGTGNLSGAETEFQDITNLGQNGPFANGVAFSNGTREQDFTAIGQALQSGNLTAAQQAFSNLKATFEKATEVATPILTANPGGPAPVTTNQPASASTGSGPEIVLNLGGAGGSTGGSTAEAITINISNPSGGGEQISIGVGQGSSAQQVTLNLGADSNEEIVLNLLGASGAASTSSTSSSVSPPNGGISVTA